MVAVAGLVAQLVDGVAQEHKAEVVGPFLLVFLAIWWTWMNVTWFASSYDTDDVPYRLLTLLRMGGVLVLAAGVLSAFGARDSRAVTLGYLVMASRPRGADHCRGGRRDSGALTPTRHRHLTHR